MEILTQRPKNMPRQQWKEYQRKLNAEVKSYRKGVIVWASNGIQNPTYNPADQASKKFLLPRMGTYRKGNDILTGLTW